MAERVTTVKLALDLQGFKASLASAKTQVKDFAGQVKSSASQQKEAWNQVGTAQAAMGAGLLAAFATIVKTTAQFDKSMSNVKADLQVSTGELGKLRDAAIEAGAKTVYSASESADAIDELGKAGVSTADILSGGLNASLSLASAGGLGVADAATIAASTLTQFGLKGTDASHIADLLAAGAGKAQGSVQDLGAALNNVGTVASNTGLSVDETTGFLAAMASYGLTGAEAGTQLKSMLQSLQGPSSTAKKAMQELGLSLYDSSGKTKTLTQFVGEYQASLKGKTQAEKDSYNTTIFGSYGIQAATVAYKEGATGIQGWIDKVDDAGYAAKVASQKMDNLAGDWENFTGALDTALIDSGSGANDMLRKLAQGATAAVNAYSDLPSGVQSTIGIVTGLAGVVGVANGAFLLGVPRVVAYREALQKMGPVARTTATGLKFLGGSLGVVTAAVAAYGALEAAQDAARPSTDAWTNTIEHATSASQLFAQAQKGSFASAAANMDATNSKIADLTGGLQEYITWSNAAANRPLFSPEGQYDETAKTNQYADALNQVGKNLASLAGTDDAGATSAAKAFGLLAKETDGSQASLVHLLATMPDYRNALIGIANDQDIDVSSGDYWQNSLKLVALATTEATNSTTAATSATAAYTPALDNASTAAADNADSLTNLVKALTDYNKAAFDAENGSIALEQSIDDAAKRIKAIDKGTKGYARTLDIGTQAGRDNMQSLLDLASASNSAAGETLNLTGSQEQVAKTLAKGREQFVKDAIAMGETRKAAEKLADKYIAIPSEIKTTIKTAGIETATQKLATFMASITTYKNESIAAPAGIAKKADGGAIRGPGTSTSDSVPAMLSTGEHVLTASDVAAMGGQDGVYAFRASLHSFAIGGASDATLKKRLAAAKHAEAVAQKHYDSISGDKKHKAAKAAADKRLKAAEKKADKAQADWDARKTANAGYTDYLSDRRSQASDVSYDKSVAAKMPNTAAGKQLAKQYLDDASSTAMQGASDNVNALRKVIADPNASKAVKAKARKQLKSQQAKLTKLQLEDLQKQADANYTSYLDGLKSQKSEVKYDQAQAKKFDTSTAIGKQMAKQYNDAAMSAALSAAQSNVDSLRAVIDDPNTSAAVRSKAKAQLKTQQKNLTDLQYKQAATDLRDSYQDAFDQTKESIASALKTIDLTSKASTTTTYDQKTNADGSVSISTRSNTGYTAAGIDSYFSTKAADNKRFAAKLKKLSGKIPSELLEYIASQGVEGGEPMADALLSASASQLADISANYKASGDAADAAGTTVAGAEYGPRIDALNKAIADGSDAIVKELSKGIKVVPNANGGIHAYANGGIPTGMYSGSQGPIYKFAEPSTRWEAFVSGKPGQEARNRRILSQAASRLGMVAFEDGGFTGYGRPRRDGAAAVSVVSGAAPVTVSMEGMVVYVTNPFTGQEVRATVARVARTEIASAQHEREVRA